MRKLLLAAAVIFMAGTAHAKNTQHLDVVCREVASKICIEKILYECDLSTPCYDQLESECVSYWQTVPLKGLDCSFLVNLEK